MNQGFHFAAPIWFLGLAVLPFLWWRWRRLPVRPSARLRDYADPHLLPHLLAEHPGEPRAGSAADWPAFVYWALLWLLLLTALAGPRWEQRPMQLATPADSLLILLDLSQSMEAVDVAPSRLGRARQEIEDLIGQNDQLRLGLLAFASVPYLIAPISEDSQGLLSRLPALSSDLARYRGSRLAPALERARQLLVAVPEDGARSILLISDGDFDEPDLPSQVAKLAAEGIRLHVLGIGSTEDALVPAIGGRALLDPSGTPVRSRLDESQLRRLADAGGGLYRQADYQGEDTALMLEAAAGKGAVAGVADGRARVWQEAFHWPLLLLALLLLPQWLPRAKGSEPR